MCVEGEKGRERKRGREGERDQEREGEERRVRVELQGERDREGGREGEGEITAVHAFQNLMKWSNSCSPRCCKNGSRCFINNNEHSTQYGLASLNSSIVFTVSIGREQIRHKKQKISTNRSCMMNKQWHGADQTVESK